METWKRVIFIPGASVPVTLTGGSGVCVEAWLRCVKDRQGGAHSGRARSKQRVAAGASPKGEASGALQRRGTACQAGNGAAITPLSRRWRDHVAPAPLPTILSALLTAHHSLPQPTTQPFFHFST